MSEKKENTLSERDAWHEAATKPVEVAATSGSVNPSNPNAGASNGGAEVVIVVTEDKPTEPTV